MPEPNFACNPGARCGDFLEHREGIEPSNTGFADQRVSHFATGAHVNNTGIAISTLGKSVRGRVSYTSVGEV